MIDFGNIDSPVSITKDFILSKLSQEQIFYQYFGSFSLGKAYCSALRVDNNPSTVFFIDDNGKIIYFDYARKTSHDCFAFVMELYKCDFQTALNKIAHDFGLSKDKRFGSAMTAKEKSSSLSFDRTLKKEKQFQFWMIPWEQRHYDVWAPFNITKEDLEKDIYLYPISELFINKKRIYNPNDLPWFVYVIRDCNQPDDPTKVFFKTYMPGGGDSKWFTNNPNSNPYGYLDLPYKTSTLIVTKSRKDMMVLRKIWPDVMAVQNESESSLPSDMLAKLAKRYERIFIWFDADEPGVESCKKFNKYGCGYINTPRELYETKKIKDPAEYSQHFGLDALQEFTFTKLNLWKEHSDLLAAGS